MCVNFLYPVFIGIKMLVEMTFRQAEAYSQVLENIVLL